MNETLNEKELKRQARVEALNALYQMDLLNMDLALDDYEGYALDLILGVSKNFDKINEIISSCLVNYTIDRLNFVDRSIIRIATFEMMNGLNKSIAINEAIEITKLYSNLDDDKQKAFNNSVLDKISKRI